MPKQSRMLSLKVGLITSDHTFLPPRLSPSAPTQQFKEFLLWPEYQSLKKGKTHTLHSSGTGQVLFCHSITN